MKSTASIMKHPIHPMLIPFPIGLWVFSLICDFVGFANKDAVWASLALYTIAGGIIGALLAALPGFVDLFTLPPSRAKTLGIWHMSINLTIVVLYAINFVLRHNAATVGIGPLALSIIAVLLLGASGWLGGEMVYVYGVAVEPADGKKSELGGLSHPKR